MYKPISSRSQLSISRLSTSSTAGRVDRLLHAGARAKQAQLAGFRGAGMVAADCDDAVERGQQGDAIAEGIQRADLDQALEAALADRAQIDAPGKIIQVLEERRSSAAPRARLPSRPCPGS